MVAHTADNSATAEARENLRLTQDGCDLDCAEALKTCGANKGQHEDNKMKAHALICSSCGKIRKSQIKEMSTFESTIGNNPFELLKTMKEKMHDLARAKHEQASSTERDSQQSGNTHKTRF